MKILIVLSLMFSFNAMGLDAVITVLEAPMFKEKNLDSLVVQYLRKGDVIKVHPALNNNSKYDQHAPSAEKLALLKKRLEESPEWQDPLFKENKQQNVYLEDEFIPTLDRQGNVVYVLSEHIYVYFNDTRELTQRVARKDPTDYRLEEPLPKNYPLRSESGHRGQMLIGFSQPYNESYVYPDQIKTKGYSSPVQLNVSLLRRIPHDTRDRFYFGANINFKSFQNTYNFFDLRQAREDYLQFGIGPLLSYDAYKGEKNRLNLSFAINFNPFNHLTINQRSASTNESRVYMAYNFSSRIGLQYHRKQITDVLDFVLGTSMDIESPATFRAQNGAGQAGWWQNLGGDKYSTRGFIALSGFVGIQAAY